VQRLPQWPQWQAVCCDSTTSPPVRPRLVSHPQRAHRCAADRWLTFRGPTSQELFDLTWRI